MIGKLDRRPITWLFLGAALLVATQVRAPFAVLAWIAPLPWLRYLRLSSGWRARAAFGLVLFAAWTLATAKIASAPMFAALAPLFALPIALSQGVAYAVWSALRTRLSTALASWMFAIAIATGEWCLHVLTPFGSWGATAYGQIDDLPLLQIVSIFGIAGVAVLVSLVAASIEAAASREEGWRRSLSVAVALAVIAEGGGTARLALADLAAKPSVLVAAIATDSDVAGLPLPSRDRTRAWDDVLVSRTREAARGGAVLAVWPEAATLVWPDDETRWVETMQRTARESGVDIVAAYVSPIAGERFAYRNEYRLFLRDGESTAPYAKHHPVPGEPAIAGTSAAPIVSREWGRLSGAICYDYDFPAMARERSSADVVAVPASDWRGIDPVHAQMAALRAIESGHSIVRSTRFGLSIAVDPSGRTRAWHSAFEPGSGVMFAELPRAHVRTPYAIWGDVPLAIAAVVAAVAAIASSVHRVRRRLRPAPDHASIHDGPSFAPATHE
jgi:apolipoprotein N-acyltransferase